MKKPIEIFKGFFQMGLLATGGGHALLQQIEKRLIDRDHLLTAEELTDLTTLASSIPGSFGLNLSLAVGYRLGGWRGAALAALGVLALPLILFTLMAMLYFNLQDAAWIQRFLRGMRPAIVALMVMPCYRLGKAARLNLSNIWIPLLTIMAVVVFRITPIYIIVLVGGCAYLYGRFVKPQENDKD